MMYLDWPGVTAGNYALLMHFDGDFSDSSQNNHSFTLVNLPVTSAARVKFGSEAWTGSGAAHVSTPDSEALEFGSQIFSVDFWVYIPSTATLGDDNTVICKWGGASLSWFFGFNIFRQLTFLFSTDGASFGGMRGGDVVPTDKWSHVAFWAYNSGSMQTARMSLDGIRMTTSTFTGASYGSSLPLHNNSQPITVFATADGLAVMPLDVTVDELRVCVGTNQVQYADADFTPPTSPYP